MSADDQAFLDVLNSVPHHLQRFSDDIANYVEQHVDKAAATLRETLSAAEWIPEAARPRGPPRAPARLASSVALPVGLYSRIHDWVLKNKVLTGTFVIGLGASIYMVQRRKAIYYRKRRAKRASNGARMEVVVIAGSISEPIVRSLALDLERRGFVVFVVCDDVQEELLVQNEARSDIRPLMIDVSEPHHASNSVERFAQYLQTPQHAFEGARAHNLQFTSLIVIPTLTYPSAPIATISPTHISDLINTRLLHPILLTQAFLPLLTSPPQHQQRAHPPAPTPKLLLLTSAIIPSLSPPFHAPESTISAALAAFTSSLSAELAPLGVPVTHIKLGAFDISSLHPKNQLATLSGQSAETRAWPYGAREAYRKNFMRAAGSAVGGTGSRGSNLRELHNVVFDEMAKTGRRAGGTVRVGQGARLYEFIGGWAPGGLVGWMMGVRTVERSAAGSSESSNAGSDAGVEGVSVESEYISVHPGDGAEVRV